MPPEVAIGAIGRLQVSTQWLDLDFCVYETLLNMSPSIAFRYVHYLPAG